METGKQINTPCTQGVIVWTRPMFESFKHAYDDAIETRTRLDDTFEFDGYTFVVGYAKYLIEYLESRFK